MGGSSSKVVERSTRLDGKTAIITGCNTGIGKVTAKEFYKIGARVIMACRDVNRANDAVNEIKKELEQTENVGELVVKPLDLSSLESVRKCAEDIINNEQNIHLLINNAGIMMVPKNKTKEGYESHFGVNHLGHFLFTCLLLPKIICSAPARIVNVSSAAHTMGSINWEDINYEKRSYKPMMAYAQSKLANVLFSLELSKRLTGKGVSVYTVHPGIVKTELGRYMDDSYFRGARLLSGIAFSAFYKTPEEGALTTLYCALDESIQNDSGLYYSDCKEKQASSAARNEEDATKLWDLSAKMVNLENFEIK